MSDVPVPGDPARLERENQALNEQIKLLVQTEQRLYRSQNDLDAQLARQRSLARFALECSVVDSTSAILGRALGVVEESFALGWAGVIRLDPVLPEVVTLVGTGRAPGAGRGLPVPSSLWTWARGLERPVLVTPADPEGFAFARELLRGVAPDAGALDLRPGRGRFACVPVRIVGAGAAGLLIGFDTGPRNAAPRPDSLTEQSLPFLQLLANHIERAIEGALLTERLHERSEQLAASLATLERTQQELLQSQKLEAVGRLAGGVAHDFNNLLTVILGYAGMLQGTLTPGTPAHDSARQILEAGQRASATTRQLLALARRQMQRREDFDLSEQAERTVALLRRLVGEDIALNLELDRGLGRVRADRSQVEQIMLNLIVNARDAMPDGGTMRVITRRAGPYEAARTEVAIEPDRFAVLEVRDTGIGMDAETRARIFEPFFTTKAAGSGTGLGLAVVYGIVKQSDGHILVESAPGQGARFLVLLPLSAQDAAPSAGPPTEGAPSSARAVVLVAEDEASIREVVVATLRGAGHIVHAVADGEEAIEWLADSGVEPDLLLTDVLMPRLGGARLAEELRRTHPELAIAFMSGYSEDLLVGGAARRRGEAFLAKPFTPDQLVRFVGELVDGRRR